MTRLQEHFTISDSRIEFLNGPGAREEGVLSDHGGLGASSRKERRKKKSEINRLALLDIGRVGTRRG